MPLQRKLPPSSEGESPLRICLASDFFCPNTGGVETHIYYLSQCLIRRGHRVVVITHAYGDRRGIRYLSNGLKVYYLPFLVIYNGCTIPTLFTTLPWIRYILIRERIQIVHGHSSFSALGQESLFHATALGLRTVFTDHSLFGFADLSSILTNKVLQFTLTNCDHVICVSHTSKENTVLRGRLRADKVSVIPNAVDCDGFKPGELSRRPGDLVTVVSMGRLTYRKGADLLAAVVTETCRRQPDVRFVVGGDGPKRVELEEARERHSLHERVHMLGAVPHSQVRRALIRGQIFLNTSLTEAFCMTIVEAASCGLHVVTTKVGGIPEVLPPDLMTLAEPNAKSLTDALETAICVCRRGGLARAASTHARVRGMYHWPDVARRTETVYRDVLRSSPLPTFPRIRRYFRTGFGFGLFFAFSVALHAIFMALIECVLPAKKIPAACDRPTNRPSTAGGYWKSQSGANHHVNERDLYHR